MQDQLTIQVTVILPLIKLLQRMMMVENVLIEQAEHPAINLAQKENAWVIGMDRTKASDSGGAPTLEKNF